MTRKKDYAALAQDLADLASIRAEFDQYVALVEKKRAERDEVIRRAIAHGLPWQETAQQAGMSVSNVGQVLKRTGTADSVDSDAASTD